jgi:serine/threonine-protein kinase
MSSAEQQRWRTISYYLDEALDLDAAARVAWLDEIDLREPAIAAVVRSLLAEHESRREDPLLSDEPIAGLAGGSLVGQQLGAYTVESLLGHGGMGTVWLAHRSDGRFEGRVAVKLLNAALLGRPAEQRFVREGSVLAKVRHSHIAQLIDAGVAPGGQPYLVLEYVEGEHIDRYCRQHRLDVERCVRLFLEVLAAVAHAHSHLVVHRDLKPSNILVTSSGVVKLLDFGVAALVGPSEAAHTIDADRGITPGYAAPEQLLGEPVTTATDVYTLGLVLYVLLTGQHPMAPEGKSSAELARATLEHDPPRPSQATGNQQLGRVLRGDLDNIVAKALEKRPADRYLTVEAFAEDLRRFLAHQPVSARPDSVMYRTGKFVRRHRGGVAAGVVVALMLVAATAVTTLQMIEAQRQRDAALYQARRAEFQAQFAYQIMSEVGGDGQPVTIRQLMEKGIEVLETNYGDDPRFVVGMLINISGRYMDLGDTNGEHAALVKAESIARQLGDPELIADVQCNTVETELAAGRPVQAAERMRDGLANLAKASQPSIGRRIACSTAQARLLWSEGELDAAVEAASGVARLVEAEEPGNSIQLMTIMSMLEAMLAEAGRLREAIDWNQRAIDALERAGRSDTLSMAITRHNQARYLYDVGEVRAAYDLQQLVVRQITAQQGPEGVPASLANLLGLYQVRLEETEAGLAWLDRAVSSARAQNNHPALVGALLNRARAYLMLGRLDGVLPGVEEAEHLAGANPEDNRAALQAAREVRARWLLADGDPATALAGIDGLLAEIGYPRQRVARRLAPLLMLKARTELALDRPAAALATARDSLAVSEAAALKPEQSADVGAALLLLAEAQRAMGDGDSAGESARRAVTALSATLGPGHSETRAATQFRLRRPEGSGSPRPATHT